MLFSLLFNTSITTSFPWRFFYIFDIIFKVSSLLILTNFIYNLRPKVLHFESLKYFVNCSLVSWPTVLHFEDLKYLIFKGKCHDNNTSFSDIWLFSANCHDQQNFTLKWLKCLKKGNMTNSTSPCGMLKPLTHLCFHKTPFANRYPWTSICTLGGKRKSP